MASGEALVIALALERRGFELIEQMPCLKLNGHSITPENDLLMRLYKPVREVRDMAEKSVGTVLLKQREQIGSTCGKALCWRGKSLSPNARWASIGGEIVWELLICLRRAKRWRIGIQVLTL